MRDDSLVCIARVAPSFGERRWSICSRAFTDDPRVKQLGPGLITGAADDDPSGIATYSQAGAQFGYSMLWTVLFTYPLMVGIQMVSARLGCITGRGLAANVKSVFPRSVLYGIVGLLLIANTINIAADIAAMGEALRLLLGRFGASVFAWLRRAVPGVAGVSALRDLCALSEVADPGAALLCGRGFHRPCALGRGRLARLVLPRLVLDHNTITMIVAVFGTTISPYLFFWQAAQEMEDLRADHRPQRRRARCCRTPRRWRAGTCGAYAGIPMWAWVFPT